MSEYRPGLRAESRTCEPVEVRQNVTSYQQPTGVVGDVAVSAERLAELTEIETWARELNEYISSLLALRDGGCTNLPLWSAWEAIARKMPASLREKGQANE